MATNPIAAAARRAKTEQRFGGLTACVRCGLSEPRALVSIQRRFLEDHHVCARANVESLTVPVCRNCHAVLTEGQRTAGVSFESPPTILHQLASALLSLFSMLFELCQIGMQWSQGLSQLAAELDDRYPEWRNLKSAAAIVG